MSEKYRIDLKNRLNEEKKPKGDGYISFISHTLSESKLDELAYLSVLLDKVGISLNVDRYTDTEKGPDYDIISLQVNLEHYRKLLTRCAGRKPNFEEKYSKYQKCTVEQLQEKLIRQSKTQIAQELGCSRMTLYRIIKNVEKLSPDGNISIWHYTSGM